MAQKTDGQLQTSINGAITTNGNNQITGAILNGILTDINDSKVSVVDSETIAGVKTFSSFPITPSSAPTTDYQTANKKYVDDNVAGFSTDHGSLSGLSDDDHKQYAQKTGVLLLNNTTVFTPDADYEPATKKYVDDSIDASGKIFSQTANKVISNTTTETTLIGTGVGSLTIPANTLISGSVIRCILRGEYSNGTAGDLSATFNILLNSTEYVSSIGLLPHGESGSIFDLSFDIIVRTNGSAGTAFLNSAVLFEVRSHIALGVIPMSSKTERTIDTTSTQTINITAELEEAHTTFSLISRSFVAEILK